MAEDETQQKIAQLQLVEQSMQSLLAQKQQFQSQLVEIDSALGETKKTTQAYKIIGNVMVAADKDELSKDLEDKKKIVELRIKTLDKQETDLRDKAKDMQAQVMKGLKK